MLSMPEQLMIMLIRLNETSHGVAASCVRVPVSRLFVPLTGARLWTQT
ncbi:hypothetical protein PAMC26510_31090 [Caballeronia sordidicola]|uniref:Uncharacterized protein n=1 Tax=Caballeronia sordidicola TaxID=196367 RepID=A0A242M8A6_CABSO|nr:hypothetical protein PAMC26510_31090 [Caballeronia sordidicola]